MNVVLIPARGGSKGIRKKNIIDLAGKPLIFYTIDIALKSSLIDKVVVSTDSNEIKEISLSYALFDITEESADLIESFNNGISLAAAGR